MSSIWLYFIIFVISTVREFCIVFYYLVNVYCIVLVLCVLPCPLRKKADSGCKSRYINIDFIIQVLKYTGTNISYFKHCHHICFRVNYVIIVVL